MSRKRRPITTTTVPTDAAARWQACPFSRALDRVEATMATYKSFVQDLGPDAHGSVLTPRALALYDALDAAAAEIGNSPNTAREVWPDAATIDDVWNTVGEGV
jgi:hypothetical protein